MFSALLSIADIVRPPRQLFEIHSDRTRTCNPLTPSRVGAVHVRSPGCVIVPLTRAIAPRRAWFRSPRFTLLLGGGLASRPSGEPPDYKALNRPVDLGEGVSVLRYSQARTDELVEGWRIVAWVEPPGHGSSTSTSWPTTSTIRSTAMRSAGFRSSENDKGPDRDRCGASLTW